MTTIVLFDRTLAALLLTTVLAACPDLPAQGTLSVQGQLDREGVEQTDLGIVDVDYVSSGARAEWWTCELRMTASSCVGSHHVNAWVTMPETTSFATLGSAGCVSDGVPFGAFEQLTSELDLGDPVLIPADVSVMVLVASDIDGDGFADLENDEEVSAASLLVSGEVEVLSLGSFDDPVSLRITGQTAGGLEVSLKMQGPTAPVPTPGGLDVARTCVAP